MNKETDQILTDGQALKDLIKSRGWGLLTAKFDNALDDIKSVMGLDMKSIKTNDDLMAQIAARQIAVETIMGVLKEVVGEADQFEKNDTVKDVEEDGHLKVTIRN